MKKIRTKEEITAGLREDYKVANGVDTATTEVVVGVVRSRGLCEVVDLLFG